MDNLRRAILTKEDVLKLDNVLKLTSSTTDYIKGLWLPLYVVGISDIADKMIIKFLIYDLNKNNSSIVTKSSKTSTSNNAVMGLEVYQYRLLFSNVYNSVTNRESIEFCSYVYGKGNYSIIDNAGYGNSLKNYYIYIPFDVLFSRLLKFYQEGASYAVLNSYPIYYEPAD